MIAGVGAQAITEIVLKNEMRVLEIAVRSAQPRVQES